LLFDARLGVPFQEVSRRHPQTILEAQDIVRRQHQIEIRAALGEACDLSITPEFEGLSIERCKGGFGIH
jgi:hypothetical protein